MQRKNNILVSSRRGMALIMAIGLIIVISTIMALSLSLTSTTTKKTGDIYLFEQAILLSKSASEYALLEISKNEPCSVKSLNFTHDNIYDVNISMKYVYSESSTCTDGGAEEYFVVQTPEQNGTVLMDISISIPRGDVTSEGIRYFRRVIEKL